MRKGAFGMEIDRTDSPSEQSEWRCAYRVTRRVRVLPTALGRIAIALLFVLTCSLVGLHASADPRSDSLLRVLTTSGQFRARAHAALSLGALPPEPAIIEGLSQALSDESPAVRAAAASSLERLGDDHAIPALRRAGSDEERTVRDAVARALRALENRTTEPRPSGSAPRYYVGIGQPGARAASVDSALIQRARGQVEQQIRAMSGVEVAPVGESPGAARRVLSQRHLIGFFLDSSIVSADQRPDGSIRVAVSVVVNTYPGRDMRVILQGAAIAPQGSGAKERALDAALASALRNLPRAMEASAASAP